MSQKGSMFCDRIRRLAKYASLPGKNSDLRPVGHAEFAHQMADVNLDRRLGKAQRPRNFLVG